MLVAVVGIRRGRSWKPWIAASAAHYRDASSLYATLMLAWRNSSMTRSSLDKAPIDVVEPKQEVKILLWQNGAKRKARGRAGPARTNSLLPNMVFTCGSAERARDDPANGKADRDSKEQRRKARYSMIVQGQNYGTSDRLVKQIQTVAHEPQHADRSGPNACPGAGMVVHPDRTDYHGPLAVLG
jgi:hypothetical protein